MKVAVVGTGTMGNGIAQTFAQAGHDVIVHQAAIDHGDHLQHVGIGDAPSVNHPALEAQ